MDGTAEEQRTRKVQAGRDKVRRTVLWNVGGSSLERRNFFFPVPSECFLSFQGQSQNWHQPGFPGTVLVL